MRIIALDLSTRATGLVTPTGALITIRPRAGADQRARRLWEIAAEVTRIAGQARPHLAVIEDYAPGAIGIDGKLRSAEVCGAVSCWLFEAGVEIVKVRPNTLKRYGTGNGRADKAHMIAAAKACGVDPDDDNAADAFWLWAMARHAYGVEPADGRADLLSARLESLGVVAWPRMGGNRAA